MNSLEDALAAVTRSQNGRLLRRILFGELERLLPEAEVSKLIDELVECGESRVGAALSTLRREVDAARERVSREED